MPKILPDETCPCGSGKLYKDCHQGQVAVAPVVSEHIRLPVIPEPDPGTRSVFERQGEGTVFFAGRFSGLSLDCGTCDAPLVVGMAPGQVVGIVLRCAACGAFNDTPPP